MNILMIAPTPFFADRGCHVRIYEEAKALQQLNCEVVICTYHNGRDISGLDTRRIPNIPWYKKLEAGPSLHMVYLDFLLLLKSLAVALRTRPDVVHGHLHEGAFIGFFIARLVRRPLVFDCQGSLTGEMKAHGFLGRNRPLYRLVGIAERRIDRAAEVVMTSSAAVARELRDLFDVPEEKVLAVPDGANPAEFRPGLDVDALRTALKLPRDKRIVVYLGLLNEYQGVDLLVRSVPLVLDRTRDVHFLIMGFPDVAKYQLMTEKLGLSEYVTFTGKIDYAEAPRYLCLGDVAVAPKISGTEANGKVYNYMACGLPVVAFDTVPSREILGNLGVYSTPGSVESLAASLVGLLANDELRRDLSRKVREKAARDYGWDRVGANIIRAYERAGADTTGVALPGGPGEP